MRTRLRASAFPPIALFPKIEPSLKTPDGAEAWNADGLIARAIRAVKAAVPELGVITDAALDPYTTHGQDGIIDADGYVHERRNRGGAATSGAGVRRGRLRT